MSVTTWPKAWRYCKVGGNKAPIEEKWPSKPYTLQEIWGKSKAIGLICGPRSGGVVMVDHDGYSCDLLIEKLSKGEGLPETVSVTSGRSGRYQNIYIVPEEHWDNCRSHKLKTGVSGEQLEFRWAGCQSVIYGEHPDTDGYKWINDPAEVEVAMAPQWIIDVMVDETKETVKKIDDLESVIRLQEVETLLAQLPPTDDYDKWIEIGMACQHHCDASFHAWMTWSKKANNTCTDTEYLKKWNSFKPIEGGLTIRTLQMNVNNLSPVMGLNGTGKKLNALQIIINLSRSLWKERLRYNEFTKDIELDGEAVDITELRVQMSEECNKDPGFEKLEVAVSTIAKENRYNPIQEYLMRCEAKEGALDDLATRYFGTDYPIYNTYVRKTLIGAVARVMKPGCKLDTTLILQGKQGYLKSTFFKVIAGEDYFDDSLGHISDKDEKLKLHMSWFIEWAELEVVFGKKGISAVKAFLSSATDVVRPPYGRKTERMQRQSIIVGTTNEEAFLTDTTGNRRFWVIPVQKKIDTTQLKAERDGILGAAYAAWKAGEEWWLTDDEDVLNEELNRDHQMEDSWEPAIRNYLDAWGVPGVTTIQLMSHALRLEISRHDRKSQMKVAGILKGLGYQRKQFRCNGNKFWAYVVEGDDPVVSINVLLWLAQLQVTDKKQYDIELYKLDEEGREFVSSKLGGIF